MNLRTIIGTAFAAIGLAACGSSSTTPAASPTPSPTATPVPTPSPTPVPTPSLVVTPGGNSATAVQLSLVGENGSVAATVEDPGGVDGHAYYVGTDDIYFLDGTTVKAFGRSGTVSTVGQVPQVKTSVTAADLQNYTTFAVSPDQTTLVFGIPVAMTPDNGATADHSQLWTEPTDGTAADATMVYDDANNSDNGGEVLMPFAWSTTGISVSEMCKGLGGVGPFLQFTGCAQATFNPTTRTLVQTPINTEWGGYLCPATVAPGSVCVEDGDFEPDGGAQLGQRDDCPAPCKRSGVRSCERVGRRTLPGVWRVRGDLRFRLLRDRGRGSEHQKDGFHRSEFRAGGVALRRSSGRVG